MGDFLWPGEALSRDPLDNFLHGLVVSVVLPAELGQNKPGNDAVDSDLGPPFHRQGRCCVHQAALCGTVGDGGRRRARRTHTHDIDDDAAVRASP